MDPITLALAKKYTDKKIKDSSGGSAGGGVTSWNDLTDRPFYENDVILFDLKGVTVQGYTPSEYKSYSAFAAPGQPTFRVVVDGVAYDQTASITESGLSGYLAFGNQSMFNFRLDDTGEDWGLRLSTVEEDIETDEYQGTYNVFRLQVMTNSSTVVKDIKVIYLGAEFKPLPVKFLPSEVVTEEQFEEELNDIKSELSRATKPEVSLVRLRYGNDFGNETVHLYEGVKTDELVDADKVLCNFYNSEDDDEQINLYTGQHEFWVKLYSETNGIRNFCADILADKYTDPDTEQDVYEYVNNLDDPGVKVVLKPDTGFTRITVYFYWGEDLEFDPANDPVSVTVIDEVTHFLHPYYLPKISAIEDVIAAPTAEQFNALLAALRSAGYMATE